MKLVKYPYSNSLQDDWNRLFGHPFKAFAPLLQASRSSVRPSTSTGVEWYELEEGYVARLDVPGVRKDELSIDLEDGLVRFSYEKATDSEASTTRRSAQQFLRIPEGIDTASVEAKLEDGVLELAFAKKPEIKPVRVEVK